MGGGLAVRVYSQPTTDFRGEGERTPTPLKVFPLSSQNGRPLPPSLERIAAAVQQQQQY